jgi:ppGpp synthetase/RelA/SpoT-type nucleotidyltranferase
LNGKFTTSQVNALGERLRKGEPSAADLEHLDAYRRSFDNAYGAVVRKLRHLRLEPSGRIKTTTSIVEKLKRQSFRLSKLQDIAGCRIVVDDITEQDRIVGLISGAWPEEKVVDRRKKHSHGYRAVHVVVTTDGRFVEIQVRTELQHLWAVWSEALADEYGQALKYGAGPAEIQKTLILQSETFRLLEEIERIIAEGMRTSQPRETLLRLSELASGKPLPAEVIEGLRWFGHLKDLIRRKEEEKEEITREILKLKKKDETS